MSRDIISTGCSGLDTMLGGGLIPGRPYAIIGDPGAGKTTLMMQFLMDGVKKGEEVLLITIDEPPTEIRENIRQFGWDTRGIRILDATPDIKGIKKGTHIQEIRGFADIKSMSDTGDRKSSNMSPQEVSIQGIFLKLKKEFGHHKYERIVLDSMTGLKLFGIREGIDKIAEYAEVQSFLRFLTEAEVTIMFSVEKPPNNDLTAELFLARGKIWLDHRKRGDGGKERAIWISHMKGRRHDAKIHPFKIAENGIVITDIEDAQGDEEEFSSAGPGRHIEEVPGEEESVSEDEMTQSRDADGDGTSGGADDSNGVKPALGSDGKYEDTPRGPVRASAAVIDTSERDELYMVISQIIMQTQKRIKDCADLGIHIDDVRNLLTTCEGILGVGDYDAAYNIAMEAKLLVDTRLREYSKKRDKNSDVVKPTTGVCSVCGFTNLEYFDDGTGSCANCKRGFVWNPDKKK